MARKFTCGKTKVRNIIVHGIAPYVKSLLIKQIQEAGEFVYMFAESLNEASKDKQMDVHICFWNGKQVESRYLGSEFMGHAAASDIL